MRWGWLLAAWLCRVAAASEAEFTFDAAQFEKKRFELGGYAELKWERQRLNPQGAFYQLSTQGLNPPAMLDRGTVTLKPTIKWRLGDAATFNVRAHLDAQKDDLTRSHTARFDEVRLSYQVDKGFNLDVGKQALKWGKGYAWNPIAFIERPKDPSDPEQAREGLSLLSMDFVKSLQGPLQTVALTTVLLPTSGGINTGFGAPGHLSVGAKLYLLYHDTDIDLAFLSRGTHTRRFGFDFSRNFGSALEVHGEWARVQDVARPTLGPGAAVTQTRSNATNYLVGFRYLNERETTFIAEYYRNGSGFAIADMERFYRLTDSAVTQLETTGDPTLFQRATALAQAGFGRPNAGRKYLYFRVTQKEPFDWLYLTPAATLIVNLNDRSWSLAPEILYTRLNNIELRLRFFLLHGGADTEFGEKQNSRRVEMGARLYF